MKNKLEIENKVAIAADAAIAVSQYLEELNAKLIYEGFLDAYTIVADVEEDIVQMLRKAGSETKLGTDVVFEIIHANFGTTNQFIRAYRDENDTPNGSTYLKKNYKSDNLKRNLHKMILVITLGLSIALLGESNVFLIKIIFDDYVYRYINSVIWYYVIPINLISVFVFAFYELKQGIKGKSLISVENNLRYRQIFRGFLWMNNLLIIGLNFRLERNNYFGEYNIGEYNISYDYIYFQITLLILVELVIYFRDNTKGWYGLSEKKYLYLVRFITIPYLMLYAGIIFSFMGIYVNDAGILVISICFLTISVSLMQESKYHPTLRYYTILIFSFILIFMSEFLLTIFFPIVIFWTLFVSNYFAKKEGTKGLVEKMKNKLEEYYSSQG